MSVIIEACLIVIVCSALEACVGVDELIGVSKVCIHQDVPNITLSIATADGTAPWARFGREIDYT